MAGDSNFFCVLLRYSDFTIFLLAAQLLIDCRAGIGQPDVRPFLLSAKIVFDLLFQLQNLFQDAISQKSPLFSEKNGKALMGVYQNIVKIPFAAELPYNGALFREILFIHA